MFLAEELKIREAEKKGLLNDNPDANVRDIAHAAFAAGIVTAAEYAILKRRNDVHFLMVGTGDLVPDVMGLVARRGQLGNFTRIATVNELPDLYAISELCMLTSQVEGFPNAIVETDRIYLQDGRLITSGGVTAGIDLALSVVAQDHGKQVAVDVAKVLLVVMKRQGGQAQFSPMTAAVAPQETPITRVQNHVLAHLDQPFTIESMAELAGMSARHFARLFAKDVQMTPMAFLQGARIDRARHLLETTDLPLKTVAFHAGFGSVRHMRFLFSEKLGLNPTQYRQQFS